ncbi:MAG TPA: hypothetical protein VGG72_35580 [Bryobacteraceae bacterium]
MTRRKAAFVYPVPPAPPTAVLVPWFQSHGLRSWRFRARGAVRMFDGGWDLEAAAYQPASIAGTWAQVEPLLANKIESLTHALIVLARRDNPLLTLEQRQQIWNRFRVPVFEQIIGQNGALLAAECEAHAGLHIESPKLEVGGLSIENGPCGCGRNTPRIRGEAQEIRAAAAYAR